eukprot:TRINITY_DN1789_c0_g1_i1.p1 TRINITY_DN1789_c0_g1~~TRINITY_DN1789_c0_g1_i1.p1  ORF type:complete len:163 (+),score=28.70 TRINITY_DN1789_c0_g1_i1:2-490(+)
MDNVEEYDTEEVGILLKFKTVKELKDMFRQNGLKLSGNKQALISRLLEFKIKKSEIPVEKKVTRKRRAKKEIEEEKNKRKRRRIWTDDDYEFVISFTCNVVRTICRAYDQGTGNVVYQALGMSKSTKEKIIARYINEGVVPKHKARGGYCLLHVVIYRCYCV